MRDLPPLFIARESQSFRKPQLDSTPFQKRSPNPERRSRFTQIRLSTDRVVTDQSTRLTGRSTVPNRELGMPVDQLCRSTELPRARCARRSTGRSTGHCSGLASDLACNSLHSRSDWIPISALFLPISLKNSTITFYFLSRCIVVKNDRTNMVVGIMIAQHPRQIDSNKRIKLKPLTCG